MNFVKSLDLSKPLAFADLKDKFVVRGPVCTHGVKTFDINPEKTAYSIGVSVDQAIEQNLTKIQNDLTNYLQGYTITPVFKPRTNDAYKPALFFKLKTYDEDNFAFECNKPFRDFVAQVVNGTALEVHFGLGVYVNASNKVAGLYYKVSKIVVA